MGFLVFCLIIIITMFLVWFFKGMNFLGPTEMGVRIKSGKIGEFCDSGFHFVGNWFVPKNYIEKRPKTTFNLAYPAVEVVTKVDEYEGIKYGSVKLKVEPIAYLKLPRNEHLKQIVESNVPFSKEGLLTFTAESVESALRGVLGQKTWAEIAQNLQEVSQLTDVQLKDKGPLKQVGFAEEDIWFGIKKVALPQEIENALLEPDKARLNLQAASFKAQ